MVSNPHGGLMPKMKARILWIRDKAYAILSSQAHRDIPRNPGHLASETWLQKNTRHPSLLFVQETEMAKSIQAKCQQNKSAKGGQGKKITFIAIGSGVLKLGRAF